MATSEPTSKFMSENGRWQESWGRPLLSTKEPVERNDLLVPVKEWLRGHPAVTLVAGLAIGGMIGWLTSRRK